MLTHQGTTTLRTPRLTLRRFHIDDAQNMFDNWASDPRVTKYLTWTPHPDIEETRKCINYWISQYDKPESYHWVITFGEQAIGSLSVTQHSEQSEWCEIGYCIGFNYWNRGIMSEALEAVIRYLFTDVNFNRIQATHHEQNIASGKVMQKCGMQYEGRHRQYRKNADGTFSDVLFYGILKDCSQALRI